MAHVLGGDWASLVGLGLLVAVVLSSPPLALGLEEAGLVLGWLGGREPAVVRLHVHVPMVDAEYCSLRVYRFSTIHNPVPWGGAEVVYERVLLPGVIATVKHLVGHAPVVAYRYNPLLGMVLPWYREPQEYAVVVACYTTGGGRARLVAAYGATVEVRITSPVMDVYVSPRPLTGSEEERRAAGGGPVSRCVFYDAGPGLWRCKASIAVSRLHSAPGVEAGLVFTLNPDTAFYLSSFVRVCREWSLDTCSCREWGGWSLLGKKLVDTDAASELLVPSGYTGAVYAYVFYELQLQTSSGRALGGCGVAPDAIIYPYSIGGAIVRVEEAYEPPPPPPHAVGPLTGSLLLEPPEDEHVSDEPSGLVSTVLFCLNDDCAVLPVDVFRAGRVDEQYTMPFYVVRSSSAYYWWFRGDDPLSFELYTSSG